MIPFLVLNTEENLTIEKTKICIKTSRYIPWLERNETIRISKKTGLIKIKLPNNRHREWGYISFLLPKNTQMFGAYIDWSNHNARCCVSHLNGKGQHITDKIFPKKVPLLYIKANWLYLEFLQIWHKNVKHSTKNSTAHVWRQHFELWEYI